jgi:predicted DCC family thiol-disulfide oxidoreductase YuxK
MERNQLIVFDGMCNLCNGTVQFIIRRDREKKFSFTPNQSGSGQEILKQHGFPAMKPSSVVYIKNGTFFHKSKAVIEILRDLGCCRNLFYVLIIIPLVMRDAIYNIIAKNRYGLFGKRENCMVPAPDLMDRFLP